MKKLLQIEFTNICNRACKYCPNSIMTRPKGYMSRDTLQSCIEVTLALHQTTVGINHYGESLLHPDFIGFVDRLNTFGISPWLYTNGDLLTDELIRQMAKQTYSSIVISGHMAQEQRIALSSKCQIHGLPAFWQVDLTPEGTTDIAGQVTGYSKNGYAPLISPSTQCSFLVDEVAVVLWNGDLVPCCQDYDGLGVFGNIHDPAAINFSPKQFKLCSQCGGHPGSVKI